MRLKPLFPLFFVEYVAHDQDHVEGPFDEVTASQVHEDQQGSIYASNVHMRKATDLERYQAFFRELGVPGDLKPCSRGKRKILAVCNSYFTFNEEGEFIGVEDDTHGTFHHRVTR